MNNNGRFFGGELNMPISSHIRFFNDVSGIPAVNLFIDGKQYGGDIPYGAFTGYTSFPPGIHEVAVYEAGRRDNLLKQTDESFTVGCSITLAATGGADNVSIYQIPEPYAAPAPGLNSYLRLINLSKATPPLDVILQNGTQIFSAVHFAELTNYKRLMPNIYTLTVRSSTDGDVLLVIPNLQLNAGKIYSIYIVKNGNGEAPNRARFVADSEYSESKND